VSCIGQPISWLRLERHAIQRDVAVEQHLAVCPACSASFAEIADDLVALPPLAVPERKPKSWLWWLAPAMTAVVAAAIVLVVIRRPTVLPDHVTTVKGGKGGEGGRQVVLGAVRERAGVIRRDVATFTSGDRWKLTLTCEPGPFLWADVAVVDPKSVDHPLAPAQLSCGNQVAIPGAFEITGRDANIVCVVLDPDVIPARTTPVPGTPGTACLTLTPE